MALRYVPLSVKIQAVAATRRWRNYCYSNLACGYTPEKLRQDAAMGKKKLDIVRGPGSKLALAKNLFTQAIAPGPEHGTREGGEDQVTMRMQSSPSIIPGMAKFLAGLAGGVKVNRLFLELALDEALSNAVFHGNLEVSSLIKSGDFHGYYRLAISRSQLEPYASRMVEVMARFTEDSAEFTISDEGKGFNWRDYIVASPNPAMPFGRGLMIIQSVATCVAFNEVGNRITIAFLR